MPLALDPTATFELVLASDEDKPAESRPTFVFRNLPDRALKKMMGMGEQIEAADGLQRVDIMHDALRLALVGWRNLIDPTSGQPIPFDPAATEDVLNATEVVELIQGVAAHVQSGPDDRKKSEPPSPSSSPRSG